MLNVHSVSGQKDASHIWPRFAECSSAPYYQHKMHRMYKMYKMFPPQYQQKRCKVCKMQLKNMHRFDPAFPACTESMTKLLRFKFDSGLLTIQKSWIAKVGFHAVSAGVKSYFESSPQSGEILSHFRGFTRNDRTSNLETERFIKSNSWGLEMMTTKFAVSILGFRG